MASRWLAFFVWAAVGFSLIAWLLQMSSRGAAVPSHALAVDTAAAPKGDWGRLFGPPPSADTVEAVPVNNDSRFKLLGVMAPPQDAVGAFGLALIAVDGNPAKAVRLGAVVDGEIVLLAIRKLGVDLGVRGAAPTLSLELPPLAAAATGPLPGSAQSLGPGPAGGGPGSARAVPSSPLLNVPAAPEAPVPAPPEAGLPSQPIVSPPLLPPQQPQPQQEPQLPQG
ncbi:MAG: hypothetical protein JNJ71_12200 [Rubrivivax sp.]|nr:hypothetical protein [Rubrivivax sp.]